MSEIPKTLLPCPFCDGTKLYIAAAAAPKLDAPVAWAQLYFAAQEVCAYAGAHGSVTGRGDKISALMDALAGIDGGSFDGAPDWLKAHPQQSDEPR